MDVRFFQNILERQKTILFSTKIDKSRFNGRLDPVDHCQINISLNLFSRGMFHDVVLDDIIIQNNYPAFFRMLGID